jgi:pyruvate dehydrogenase E2 component (dihydrolipoamide acetyltransferase)
MAIPVEMPKLGNTVEECLIARWYKQAGDAVSEGEILAEIETDKATFELTAPVGGTLLGTFFKEGDLVPVFANVCVLGTQGESIEKFRPQTTATVPTINAQSTAAPQKRDVTDHARTAATPIAVTLSPRARRFAEEHNFYPKNTTGSGPGGRILEEDIKQLYYESPRTTSLAEKMIESGFELGNEGSETKRRILSHDLTSPPIGMSSIRERIARRMRNSLATTAQYTMNASAVATGLLSLRARIKAGQRQEDSASININDMVLFCVIKALEAVPEINAELVDGKIYRNPSIHLGFACDTPKGLLVPVIRDSQKLTLPELARQIKALTGKAIEGSITPDELSCGTFTVSNMGNYGIESFSPILNPPQVAILGVNTIELRPVRRNGAVEFVEHIGLSLTCDHQVIDGAPGARFLKTVKEQIENIENIVGKEF